jgi:hypothetical protein
MEARIASAFPGVAIMFESTSGDFQLCFRSLFHSGRGFSFPCDPQGRVDLDQLSDKARNNYLFARAMVGRDLAVPAVEQVVLH